MNAHGLKSPWSDPRVRKAASLALDRQVIVDSLAPGSQPAGSLGLQGDSMAVHFPADPYDPAGAKKLLAEAGYPKGFHGGPFYPFLWPLGEMVANYWKAIGITVDILLLDRPAWSANRAGGKMKGSTFIEPLAAPTIGGRLLYLFGSASYGNHADVKELWDQYNKTVDPKVRKDLIAELQGLIHQKTMFIPIRSSATPHALGPKVKGDPFKIQPFIFFTAPYEDVEMAD